MELSDRGLLYPILGLATASALTAAYQLLTGNYPGALTIAHLYLVGLGTGLVMARFGRLGAFGGMLGSPWHEARIEEVLNREVARARQYGRDLSLIAVKPDGKPKLDLRKIIRATDQVLCCRDGWKLIVLPETDAQSAGFLMRKMFGGQQVLAATTSIDAERPRQQHLKAELLELLRSATHPEIISIASAKEQLGEINAPETQALAS